VGIANRFPIFMARIINLDFVMLLFQDNSVG
jgi:hypothetical protein